MLLLSLLTAIAAGILLRAATHSTPLAVLTGGTAFAGARAFVDRLISQSDSLQATLTSTTGSAACSTTQG
ncbi:hypothetical protein UO65_3563 [Actinokineospora spheciospongiae]|uniref:Uncharacterized protein n=1 Tax=Actinokineospora spheciospongiae TaxID=909613 RepID=W7ILC4_9PSEU|nr:hypothetical protein UO65_3563 [Actinokineospora spheciospongiae]